jgi:hypothetical protein
MRPLSPEETIKDNKKPSRWPEATTPALPRRLSGGRRNARLVPPPWAAALPNQQISFTKAALLRQARSVGKLLASCLLLLTALSWVRAQEQENKLVDRLLRPDMTLQNSEQKKKFIADGASINKRAPVGTFYVQKKSNSKSFSGIRDFLTRHFNSQPFHGRRSAFEVSSQQAIGNSPRTYATQTARGPRDAPQSDKKIASRAYAENRPFLDQGKSQKSLDRQNAPLTIEQVRELLNKNK